MQRAVIVQLMLQIAFQLGIIALGGENIIFLGGIGGHSDDLHRRFQNRRTPVQCIEGIAEQRGKEDKRKDISSFSSGLHLLLNRGSAGFDGFFCHA